MTLIQKEPKNIYVYKEQYTDYSAMQWPCSEWFHVPTNDEWTSLNSIWLALGAWNNSSDKESVESYLKMPFAWRFKHNTAAIADRWSYAYYWSCDAQATDDSYMFYCGVYIIIPNQSYKSGWLSIRPFKDMPVVPDSSWTELYSWAWDAWIYHNSSLWLISLSSDWTNWITMADKNLWATVVYNSWDTLDNSNCWKYYQRWNNYWFEAWTTYTTSWTRVNASTYWPWNYYNSSTFIIRSSYPYGWDSSDNGDLRWWVTWPTTWGGNTEIKKVYMWKTPISMNKWPCADGFHIPSFDEVGTLVAAMTALWQASASSRRNYLKIPQSWRLKSNWTIEYLTDRSFFWTTRKMPIFTDSYNACTIRDWYDVTASNSGLSSSYWLSIRPFKDIVAVPDSSRTAVYSNRIYWNSILWLISISSDWINWITIADKNLWAENVNDIWSYFQWWNNYWFPQNWFDTSSTLVDTSWYWSNWVFYSSSTFITWNTGTWQEVPNDTLWNYNYWWDIQIRPKPYIPQYYTDTLIETYSTSTSSTSYYYWEKFTALKDWEITEVWFLNNNTLVWLMVILDVSSNTPTNYSLSTSNTAWGVFTLWTPYEIKAWKTYCIWVKRSSGNNLPYYNSTVSYPITWDVIQYTNWITMTTSYWITTSVSAYVFKYIKSLA